MGQQQRGGASSSASSPAPKSKGKPPGGPGGGGPGGGGDPPGGGDDLPPVVKEEEESEDERKLRQMQDFQRQINALLKSLPEEQQERDNKSRKQRNRPELGVRRGTPFPHRRTRGQGAKGVRTWAKMACVHAY